MVSIKQQVVVLIERVPEDCAVEGIQYHLYVLGKVRSGLERAATEG